MKKKIIPIVCLLSVIALLAFGNIRSAIEEHRKAKAYDKAFHTVFVTEKNAVAELYAAIEDVVNTPDDEHYAAALNAAVSTQQICCDAYGEICDSAATYGAGLVYYSTFYRDVKSALETRQSTDALKHINTLLEKILLLYNAPPSSVNTASEKVKEIEGFYKSLSLLNDDMMNLTEYLSDI